MLGISNSKHIEGHCRVKNYDMVPKKHRFKANESNEGTFFRR